MQSLRIGIDISPLRGRKTGIGFHLENLLRALRKQPDLELVFFNGSRWTTDLEFAAHGTQDHTPFARMLGRAARWMGPLAMPGKEFFNHAIVRRKFKSCKNFNLQAVHRADFPLFGLQIPEILTVFDISCIRHPETHTAQRVAWQRRHLPRALAAAAHIITISEFSKNEISSYFGVAPQRISVTLCGVGPEFHPRDEQEIRAALAPLSLRPMGYILSVGTIEPRKNLVTLIRAHGALAAEIQRQFPLVIAGRPGWKTEEIMALAAGPIANQTLRMPGYVTPDSLPALYAGAMAFAYPSLYEGFGLPPLEAMASGVPTIVSDCSSLPEVVGDAGMRVAPFSVDQWRHCLLELLNNQDLRSEMRANGLRRAATFSWERTAEQTVGAYRQTAGRVH